MNDPRSGEPDRDKDRDELGQSETQRPSTSDNNNTPGLTVITIEKKSFVFTKISMIGSIFQTTEHQFKI